MDYGPGSSKPITREESWDQLSLQPFIRGRKHFEQVKLNILVWKLTFIIHIYNSKHLSQSQK